MRELILRMAADETRLSVPDSLDAITTYVLLEQEAWFEKEAEFIRGWIKPGMTAIDIGANLGVYSVPIARKAGPAGSVYAYEPASETREHLSRSAVLNECTNLHVLGAAVSDKVGEGHLSFGQSSELNALGGGGAGETVRLTSLDHEDAAQGWRSPDFIKIDAEGEEERILQGGAKFFARHSPLVMFEIRAGDKINQQLHQQFLDMGYEVFRLLPGAPVLVPQPLTAAVDAFELNLFAAKPDRAAALEREQVLVRRGEAWHADAAARAKALDWIGRRLFGRSLIRKHQDGAQLDPLYRDALAAFTAWRDPGLPLGLRTAALSYALDKLQPACAAKPSLPRLSTLSRVAWDAGERLISVTAASQLIERLLNGDSEIAEPFLPASPRFDAIDPQSDTGAWFVCSAFEQFERAHSYSSIFAASKMDLKAMCANRFASAEIERRLILQLSRAKQRPKVPARLKAAAKDHVNAEIWRAGLVPGTDASA